MIQVIVKPAAPHFDAWFAKANGKSPARRFASAAEMVAAMATWA
jgi:hypothetical protein